MPRLAPRQRLILAWCRGIAVALVVLGWSSAARADPYGVVTLDLRPEAGDVPTHLCVVSEANSPRTRRTLDALLESEPDTSVGADTWRVLPSLWGGDSDSSERQRCSTDPVGDCRPRLELPLGLGKANNLHVACSSDSLAPAGASVDPRPLFILLEHLEGSPPAIDSVRLTGGIATIGVRANLDQVVVTARSLGGHYLPHPRSERGTHEGGNGLENQAARKLVSLAITPRCHVVEVTLPRTRLEPSDRDRLSLRLHGVDMNVAHCVGALTGTGTLQVRVPQAPLGVGTLDIDLAATETKAAARFGARWEGLWPGTPFALQFNQVSFSWRRPACIYPDDTCPTATLESGTTCSSSVTPTGCDYRCPGEVGDSVLDLELPVEVTFEKRRPDQRWTDTLAANGQTLTSYVRADDIYLNANVNAWETDTPGARVTGLELFGEDGEIDRFGISHVPNLQLRVPGGSCEPIRFRPSGDLRYEEGLAHVRDGSIDFGPPERLARRTAFKLYLAVGGGPAWSDTFGPQDVPPVYFSALGQFAFQFRARKPGWSRVGWDLRVGGTLGRWGSRFVEEETEAPGDTQPAPEESTDPIAETEQLRAFGWARVFVEPGMVVSLSSRIEVGAGMGLGFSFPIRRDQDLTGDRINFIWTPSLDGRYRVRRWVSLMMQFRPIFGERAFSQDSGGDTSNADEPDTTEAQAQSLLVLFGTAFSF